uniref:Uncharacterized protein n=1 Tax=Arundo donax TaxID=35708 RepID=A0A0A8XUT2_ARUDO
MVVVDDGEGAEIGGGEVGEAAGVGRAAIGGVAGHDGGADGVAGAGGPGAAPPGVHQHGLLVRLLLHADQLGVGAATILALGHELVVRADLGDGAALQDGDEVGLADGGEAVGDHQRGATDHEAVQRLLHQLLRLGVERAGGLVQQQDRRVLEHGAGDGDPLLLTAGQLQAAITHLGVVAVGQLDDEGVGVSDPGGLLHLRLRRALALPAQQQILLDARREQRRLLAHQTYLLPHPT